MSALLLLTSSCNYISTIGGPPDIKNGVDHIDPTLSLSREDYRHIAAPKSDAEPKLQIEKGPPPVPKLAEILAAPRPPKIAESQLVSIAVTDDVPLKDVLLELAKLADVDVELDAGISGGIEFIAKDKPFNEVIDRICELAGLRYTMKNNVLRVERDTPYIKSYSIDFLNLDRDSNSAVNLSTNVLSSGAGGSSGGGSGLTTGSTSSVSSKAAGDFWASLQKGVEQILAYQAVQHVSATTLQAETDSNVISALTGGNQQGGGNGQGASNGAAGGANGGAGASGASAAAAKPAAQQPPAVSAATQANNNSIANGLSANKTSYTINRQAGVLTVNATESQHELIQRFLDKLQANASAQVLIEAKIIEVDLNEQYQSGINWNVLSDRYIHPTATTLTSTGLGQATALATNSVAFAVDNSNLLLTLIEQFGTTRTLSSPRLHAINNQQSTMTFAKNTVYFQITVTPATTTTTGTVSTTPTAPTVSSTVETVPIGVMMTMMPSIDLEKNEVTLSVRPTLSALIDFVPDPVVAFEVASACQSYITAGVTCPIAGLTNNIPEVQVRELDSTLKLKNGQTMVIGGLMQQASANTDSGVPFASGIPVIGNLFKATNKNVNNTELVLLIKATIVNSSGSLNKLDKGIFDKFSDDPRPVSF